jgi:hypothetical protein
MEEQSPTPKSKQLRLKVSEQSPTPKSKQLRLKVSLDDYERLEKLAAKRGKTIYSTVRDALALELWFEETQDEGGRILVERDGKAREIVAR